MFSWLFKKKKNKLKPVEVVTMTVLMDLKDRVDVVKKEAVKKEPTKKEAVKKEHKGQFKKGNTPWNKGKKKK